jgi:hypothetical protein
MFLFIEACLWAAFLLEIVFVLLPVQLYGGITTCLTGTSVQAFCHLPFYSKHYSGAFW